MRMTKRKMTKAAPEDLDAIEAHLAGTLQPVAPPEEVVQRLRVRIQMPNREEIVSRLGDWYRLFFVFGGVISGMMLLITIARAFYYLTGRKG